MTQVDARVRGYPKGMRARRLLLTVALLTAAFPAAAQSRGASRAKVPLRYEALLGARAPTLSAGSAFLTDAPAQLWFREHRPEKFPALVRDAFALADWESVLAEHDDPRVLREVILSRQDDALAREPARLLALIDRTPALAAKRRLYAEAVLDWSIFPPDMRADLGAHGAGEENWPRLSLPQRYETLRRVLAQSMANQITIEPGHPDYVRQYEAALARTGPVMTDQELAAHEQSIARARRLSAELSRGAQAAGAAADATAAALSGAAHPALEAAPDAAAPAYDLSPEETRALLLRLAPALRAYVGGTPLGDELLAAVGDVDRLGPGVGSSLGVASYNWESHVVIFNSAILAQVASALGRAPRDLLNDDEALADVAVVYSHLFVHEATHHRQYLRAREYLAANTLLTYHQQSEVEAVRAQARFLKEKRAADPDFAARETRLRTIPGLISDVMRSPGLITSNPHLMKYWLAQHYRLVPSLPRSSARLIQTGITAAHESASSASRIDALLARRRRRPPAERRELQALGLTVEEAARQRLPADWIATRELRRLRDALRGQALAMVAAAAALSERARVELERLAN